MILIQDLLKTKFSLLKIQKRTGVFVFCFLALTTYYAPRTACADLTAPSAITGVTGMMGSGLGTIRLNWTSPGDDNLTGDLVAGSSFTIQYTTMADYADWSPTAAQPGFAFRVKLATSYPYGFGGLVGKGYATL